jgi:hypothetical protein
MNHDNKQNEEQITTTTQLKEEGIHIVQMSLTPTNYGKNASIWLCRDVVHMHMHLRIIWEELGIG